MHCSYYSISAVKFFPCGLTGNRYVDSDDNLIFPDESACYVAGSSVGRILLETSMGLACLGIVCAVIVLLVTASALPAAFFAAFSAVRRLFVFVDMSGKDDAERKEEKEPLKA